MTDQIGSIKYIYSCAYIDISHPIFQYNLDLIKVKVMKFSEILIIIPLLAHIVYSFQNHGSMLQRSSIYRINIPVTKSNIPSSRFSLYHKSYTSLNTFPAVKSSDNNENNTNVDNADNKDNKTTIFSKLKFFIPILALIGVGFIVNANGGFNSLKSLDIGAYLEATVEKVASLGPLGYIYFSLIYIAAEILAIPVMPLTASSGYLFGLLPGAMVVLLSATVAACISFFIGRFFLRDWARSKTAGNSLWKMIDTAVGREGFKIILLLRLSPLLPFALSNYLYGITSVDFG